MMDMFILILYLVYGFINNVQGFINACTVKRSGNLNGVVWPHHITYTLASGLCSKSTGFPRVCSNIPGRRQSGMEISACSFLLGPTVKIEYNINRFFEAEISRSWPCVGQIDVTVLVFCQENPGDPGPPNSRDRYAPNPSYPHGQYEPPTGANGPYPGHYLVRPPPGPIGPYNPHQPGHYRPTPGPIGPYNPHQPGQYEPPPGPNVPYYPNQPGYYGPPPGPNVPYNPNQPGQYEPDPYTPYNPNQPGQYRPEPNGPYNPNPWQYRPGPPGPIEQYNPYQPGQYGPDPPGPYGSYNPNNPNQQGPYGPPGQAYPPGPNGQSALPYDITVDIEKKTVNITLDPALIYGK